MLSLAFSVFAAFGTYLLLTTRRTGDTDSRVDRRRRPGLSTNLNAALAGAGLDDVSAFHFVAASLLVGGSLGALFGMVFGFGPSTLIITACGATVPALLWRRRRVNTRRVARESWPRLIDELRVMTGSAGRPIPQALIDVGLNGPDELRPAFRAAQREWALTTDFGRMISVLKSTLADPAADATFETLLVAVEVGGNLDSKLAALAEDRRQDLLGRKDAQAKQSGARFARIFVVVVPAGMAVAGLSVGDGADAYRTTNGQVLVSVGVALVVACWVWASRIMRLPEPRRVFDK